MLGRDEAALERLYADDLIYTHTSGRKEIKSQAIDAVIRGKTRYEAIDFADRVVRSFGTTAVVNCRGTLKMITDNVPRASHLDILWVWVKSAEGWRLVARLATSLNP